MPVSQFTITVNPDGSPAVSDGGGDGSIRLIEDMCSEAISLLLAQYKDSPRLQDLIASWIARVQELEQASFDVYSKVLDLDTAEGNQLDLIGRIVGERRNGLSDTNYRNALRVRVLINISDGKIEQLIRIARLFEQMDDTPGSSVQIQDLQPARMEIRLFAPPLNPASQTFERLRQAKAGGVALHVIFHYGAGVSGNFTFIRAADYPEKSTDEGFTNLGADVTGGRLAHVIG